MSKPTIRIHDTATGKVIDREMTDAEYVAWQAQQAQNEALLQAETAKQAARQTALNKLAALGLTADEIKALVG